MVLRRELVSTEAEILDQIAEQAVECVVGNESALKANRLCTPFAVCRLVGCTLPYIFDVAKLYQQWMQI